MKWTPHKRAQVRLLFRKGLTIRQAAEKLGVSYAALKSAVTKYGLADLPNDLIGTAELCRLLGVNGVNAKRLAESRGIKVQHYGWQWAIAREDGERLLADRPDPTQVLDRVPDGYLMVKQIAESWGLCAPAVYKHLEGLPHIYARAPRGRFVRCYHLADIEPRRWPSLRARPRDSLSTSELMKALGYSEAQIRKLVKAGCPRLGIVQKDRTAYYRLADVLTWLEQSGNPRWQRRAAYVRRTLAQQEAA